ncbi:MAG: hypothetical protein AVDCRST_MAG78-1717 [uncultured Rubrobacteraceae bacterium]|uniref:Uncharacterized protein n=1 Tax=uncultured Rubrobacteraceae bacterium TaxID=349277 RepID=A0A6J4Q948_9ACTN|nr:MAG: hypothetical protein AVDCRST_MAG78-1717 [uncultured Rubrobacteraceae bacterium]
MARLPRRVETLRARQRGPAGLLRADQGQLLESLVLLRSETEEIFAGVFLSLKLVLVEDGLAG